MAGKSKRPKFHPSERVDGIDMETLTSWHADRVAQHNRVIVSAALKLISGFRIKYAGSGLAITVTNGMALDGSGELVGNNTLSALEKTVQLSASVNYYFIGVKFQLVDSDSDSRSFWDQTVDNGAGVPTGREFSRNVPTRLSEEWTVVAVPKSLNQIPAEFADAASIVVPLCVLRTDGTTVVHPVTSAPFSTSALEPVRGLVLGKTNNNVIRLNDSTLFPDSGYFRIPGELGDSNAPAYTSHAYSSNNRAKSELTLPGAYTGGIVPGTVVEVRDSFGAPLRTLIPNDVPGVDLRTYLYRAAILANNLTDRQYVASQSSSALFNDSAGRVLVQDGLPTEISTNVARTNRRTSPASWESRSEENIKDLYQQLEVLKHQLKEIKFGQSASSGSAGVTPDRGDFYYDDMRASTLAGASLRESLASYVTIGEGGTNTARDPGSPNLMQSFGYYNVSDYATTVDCFEDAMSALPATGGVIYIKPGTYTLASTVVVSKPIVFQGHSKTSTIIVSSSGAGLAALKFALGSVGGGLRDATVRASTSAIAGSEHLVVVGVHDITFTNCEMGNRNPLIGFWANRGSVGIAAPFMEQPVVVDNCSFYMKGDPSDIPNRPGATIITVNTGNLLCRGSRFVQYGSYRTTDSVPTGCIYDASLGGNSAVTLTACTFVGGWHQVELRSSHSRVSDCEFHGYGVVYGEDDAAVNTLTPGVIVIPGAGSLAAASVGQYLNVWAALNYKIGTDFASGFDTAYAPQRFFSVRINAATDDFGTLRITDYEVVKANNSTNNDNPGTDIPLVDFPSNTRWDITEVSRAGAGILLDASVAGAAGGTILDSCVFTGQGGYNVVARQPNVVVTGCTLYGSHLFTPTHYLAWAWQNDGVVGTNTVTTVFDSCDFKDIKFQAVRIDGSNVFDPAFMQNSFTRIANCTFDGNQHSEWETNNGVTTGNKASQFMALVGPEFISQGGGGYWRNTHVTGCTFRGSYHRAIGCLMDGLDNDGQVFRIKIESNTFLPSSFNDTATDALYHGAPVYFGTLWNSTYSGAGEGGEIFNNISVINNTFNMGGSSVAAIAIGAISDDVTGVPAQAKFSDITISGNYIVGYSGTGRRPLFGILLNGQYLFDKVLIEGNDIRGVSRAGISTYCMPMSGTVGLTDANAHISGMRNWIINDNIIYDVNTDPAEAPSVAGGADPYVYQAGIFIGNTGGTGMGFQSSVQITNNDISDIGTFTSGIKVFSVSGVYLSAMMGSESNESSLIDGNTIKHIGTVEYCGSSVVAAAWRAYNGSAGSARGTFGSYGILVAGGDSGETYVSPRSHRVLVSNNVVTSVSCAIARSTISGSTTLSFSAFGCLSGGIVLRSVDASSVTNNRISQIHGNGIIVSMVEKPIGTTDQNIGMQAVSVSDNNISECWLGNQSDAQWLPALSSTDTDATIGNSGGYRFVLPGIVVTPYTTVDSTESSANYDADGYFRAVSIRGNSIFSPHWELRYSVVREQLFPGIMDFSGTGWPQHTLNDSKLARSWDGGSSGICFIGNFKGLHISDNQITNYRNGIFVASGAYGNSHACTGLSIKGNNITSELEIAPTAFFGTGGIQVYGANASNDPLLRRRIEGVDVSDNFIRTPGFGYAYAQYPAGDDGHRLVGESSGIIKLAGVFGFSVNNNTIISNFDLANAGYLPSIAAPSWGSYVAGYNAQLCFRYCGIGVSGLGPAAGGIGASRGHIMGNTVYLPFQAAIGSGVWGDMPSHGMLIAADYCTVAFNTIHNRTRLPDETPSSVPPMFPQAIAGQRGTIGSLLGLGRQTAFAADEETLCIPFVYASVDDLVNDHYISTNIQESNKDVNKRTAFNSVTD